MYSVLISDVKGRGDRKEPAIDSLIHESVHQVSDIYIYISSYSLCSKSNTNMKLVFYFVYTALY